MSTLISAPEPAAPVPAQRRILGQTRVTLAPQSSFRLHGRRETAAPTAGRVATPNGVVHVGFLLGVGEHPLEARGEHALVETPADYTQTRREAISDIIPDSPSGLDIELPQGRLLDRGVRLRGERMLPREGTSLGGPLRAFALSLFDSAWAPTKIGSAVAERTIEDLVVGMFLEFDDTAIDVDDLRAALRARAVSQIDEKHRDINLTPTRIAEQLGVSLRHLQRAFEHSGTSLTATICHRRTESAAMLLTAPGSRGLTMTEIAAHSGFASSFELRAAFRSQFGVLPSEFRRDRSSWQGSSAPAPQ
ncbi:MAG TPA: helix-turn-helix transcriptional regulator [Glaciihabitans sp.]|nr:helix-turn-helix transcriptional regulator [Glaciihabitans sp.]